MHGHSHAYFPCIFNAYSMCVHVLSMYLQCVVKVTKYDLAVARCTRCRSQPTVQPVYVYVSICECILVYVGKYAWAFACIFSMYVQCTFCVHSVYIHRIFIVYSMYIQCIVKVTKYDLADARCTRCRSHPAMQPVYVYVGICECILVYVR